MNNLPLSNQVKSDSTLEQLQITKQGWLDMARQAGYPEICWQIVRWLGTPVASKTSATPGTILIWSNKGLPTRISQISDICHLEVQSRYCIFIQERITTMNLSLDEIWAESPTLFLEVSDSEKEQDFLYRREKMNEYRYLANAARRRGSIATAEYYEGEVGRLMKIGDNSQL